MCTKAAPGSFQGSAHIDGAENISAVALVDNGTRAYTIEAVPSGAAHGGLGTRERLYFGSHLRNFYGWNSVLTVHNVNASSLTFSAFLYNDAGTQVGSLSNQVLGPRASTTFSLNGIDIGSARIMTTDFTKPVAGVVRHEHAGADTLAYAATVEGGSANFAAVLMKDYYGWNSSSSTHETDNNSASVNVNYTPSGSESFNVNARGGKVLYMGNNPFFPGGIGAGRYQTTTSNRAMTAAIHHANGFYSLGYPVLTGAAKDLYVPWVQKNLNGWDASVTVFNPGASQASVWFYQYNQSGTLVNTHFGTIAPYQMKVYYTELQTGVHSVYVQASVPVAAVEHGSHNNGRAIGYTAVPIRAFAP
jgi:hypothetical protein